MFRFDPRLEIELPDFPVPFEELPKAEQEDILLRWESIRARIPEQIMKFESIIEDLLEKVHHEDNWDEIAAHFAQISDYASRINELNTWRRIDQALHPHSKELTAEHVAREK